MDGGGDFEREDDVGGGNGTGRSSTIIEYTDLGDCPTDPTCSLRVLRVSGLPMLSTLGAKLWSVLEGNGECSQEYFNRRAH